MYSGLFDSDLMSPELFMSIHQTLPMEEVMLTGDAIFKAVLDTSPRLRSEGESEFLTWWKAFKYDQAKFTAKQKALAKISSLTDQVPGTEPAPVAPIEEGSSLSTPMIVGGASAALLIVALLLKKRKKK